MTEKEINKLVSDNINYVKSVANHYRGNGVDFDDLVSEGTLAMLTAAQKYDAERGSQFVAYALSTRMPSRQTTIQLSPRCSTTWNVALENWKNATA